MERLSIPQCRGLIAQMEASALTDDQVLALRDVLYLRRSPEVSQQRSVRMTRVGNGIWGEGGFHHPRR